MRVVVTGGTGFIGANVVRHLLARGDSVRCLVRASSPTLGLDELEVERVPTSLTDPERLIRHLDGFEGLYHLAGTFDAGPSGMRRMYRVHVEATRALLRAAHRAGLRRVVLCSSSITVGFGPRDRPGDEETPVDPGRVYGRTGPLRAYHDTKRAAERLASEWTERGLEVVVLNPDYTVGAWDIKPTSGAPVLLMARRWIPFWARGGKCFVDADDVAEAHLLAMDRGQPGRRYLLGTENLSYREFLGMVSEEVGRRPPLAPLPRVAVPLAGGIGLGLALVAPDRVGGLERHVLAAAQEDRYRTGARAVDELGVGQTPIRKSIAKAYRWFVDHGYT